MANEILNLIEILGIVILAVGVFAKCIYKDKKGYIWMVVGLLLFIYCTFIKLI